MRSSRIPFLVLLTCVLVLSACNLPDRVAGSQAPSIAPVAVMLSASSCWSGPGETFAVVIGLSPGQNAEIAGRTPDAAYLLLRDPANPATLCWIRADAATIVGDVSRLPTYGALTIPSPLTGCPSPVGGGPTPVDCSAAVGSGCPSPVGGGPTPVDCSAAVGSGCPSPVGGGPTPVDCSAAVGSGCPSPVGGGPTPVDCSAAVGSGCPSPVGGGPTPVDCSAAVGSGCPSPVGGGPTPVVCSAAGDSGMIYGCPSPIGGGPTPVDCSGSNPPPPPLPGIVPRKQPTPIGAPAPFEGPVRVAPPTVVQ